MSIGENLKKARRLRKMTQSELAKALGVTTPTIANYENGRREPNLEQCQALADALNVRVADLVGDAKSETNAFILELETRPELRLLFSVAKDASHDDIVRAIAIIEALKQAKKG